MSAHIMTILRGYSDPGPGTRNVRALFRGPSLAGGETGYDTGGSILDLTTKPAAAVPVSDAVSTSQMLYNGVNNVDLQVAAAFDNQYRVRYVLGAGAAPGLGLVKVFAPAATVYTEVITRARCVAEGGAALTFDIANPVPFNHRVVGGRITVTELFNAGASAGPLTAMGLTIGYAAASAEYRAATDIFTGGVALGQYSLNTAAMVAGMHSEAPDAANTIEIRLTAVGNNHADLAAGAGEVTVELWVIDNAAFADPANWAEVAAGTDLSAFTFAVDAAGL